MPVFLSHTYQFKYDKLGQLLVADHSASSAGDIGTSQETKYDANGNILLMNVGSATKNYTYHDNTNRVKNVDGSLNNHYLYDEIGNITQSVPKAINSLTYDPFVNRTKTISMSSGNNMNFSYDGTERRVYKKDVVSSVTTEILYLHERMDSVERLLVLSTFFWQRAKRNQQILHRRISLRLRKALELLRTWIRFEVHPTSYFVKT